MLTDLTINCVNCKVNRNCAYWQLSLQLLSLFESQYNTISINALSVSISDNISSTV